MTLKIKVSSEKDKTKILVDGDLDQISLKKDLWLMLPASDLETVKHKTKVKLSLASVSHVDTAGLAWVINALADMSKHSIDVTIEGLPEKLLNLAKLSNADELLSGY